MILKKANDDLVRRVNELTSKKAEQEEACKSVSKFYSLSQTTPSQYIVYFQSIKVLMAFISLDRIKMQLRCTNVCTD